MKINLRELKSNIFQLIIIALMCLIVVGFIAFIISTGKTFKIGDLGSLGDFFGGILNPIFSFLAFLALLTTIILQASELKATRKELRKSAKAQKKQSRSLKLQNKATKNQIFENTFFKLIELFNEELKKLTLEITINSGFISINGIKITYNNKYESLSFGSLLGKSVIINLLKLFKMNYFPNYDKYNSKMENITGIYFGQIYQILKFIDESNIKNKQRYVNIFRAQFTKDELEFLFYHCLGTIGKRKFKKLVEDYEFFEHIILNENIQKQLLEYDKKAFGKNEKILKLFE